MHEASKLLKDLFTGADATPQEIQNKKDSLQRLHETFQYVTEQNLSEYIVYLQEWVLNEVDVSCLKIFAHKVSELQKYLASSSKPSLAEKLFPLHYYLLQQEEECIRLGIQELTYQLFLTPSGQTFLKNTIKNLLKSPNYYHGYDSALAIFSRFKERFYENKEFNVVINHDHLYQTYRSKKILLQHISSLAQSDIAESLLEALLISVKGRLINDSEEIIHVAAISALIYLLQRTLIMKLWDQQRCFEEVKAFYDQKLIRTRFTLLKMTPVLVELLPREGIWLHFQFMMDAICVEESELTEVCINNLKHIFRFISGEDRERCLMKLLDLPKSDIEIEISVARNIIDLLESVGKEEALVEYLSKFIQKQDEHVKLNLVKSFFKHEHSKHLYVYFKQVLDDLYKNPKWRIRLESLEILANVMDCFSIDDDIIHKLHLLIHDKAARVRNDTIKILKKHINDPMIQSKLIPGILGDASNVNYLIRILVLFFIKETHALLTSQTLRTQYSIIVTNLCKDPVPNVSEIALNMVLGV